MNIIIKRINIMYVRLRLECYCISKAEHIVISIIWEKIMPSDPPVVLESISVEEPSVVVGAGDGLNLK